MFRISAECSAKSACADAVTETSTWYTQQIVNPERGAADNELSFSELQAALNNVVLAYKIIRISVRKDFHCVMHVFDENTFKLILTSELCAGE